jgi:hypothetical protein
MSRTTRQELDDLAAMINRRLGADDYAIGYAYGSPRLERDGGARDVSPRLPAGQLADWMRAFLAGIDAYAAKADPIIENLSHPDPREVSHGYRAEDMGQHWNRGGH